MSASGKARPASRAEKARSWSSSSARALASGRASGSRARTVRSGTGRAYHGPGPTASDLGPLAPGQHGQHQVLAVERAADHHPRDVADDEPERQPGGAPVQGLDPVRAPEAV